jgi:plastocyanin
VLDHVFITKLKLVLGMVSMFAVTTLSGLTFITSNSTPSVVAQEGMQSVNVSIVKDAALKGDKAYQPNPVNVTVGQELVWTNNDTQIHTVTSGAGPSDPQSGDVFNSGIMSPKATFGYIFNQTGEVPYYCTLHPQMIGTVIIS